MIFVTLGTQDKGFARLLAAIDKQIENGNIKDQVIVQAGYTRYHSNNMEIHELISMEDFEQYMADCDLLITHAGVGSIMTGLNHGKKIIAAARLKEYDEHTNNHQLQIASEFSKEKYIIYLDDFNNLAQILETSKTFTQKKYEGNNKKFIEIIEHFIEQH